MDRSVNEWRNRTGGRFWGETDADFRQRILDIRDLEAALEWGLFKGEDFQQTLQYLNDLKDNAAIHRV